MRESVLQFLLALVIDYSSNSPKSNPCKSNTVPSSLVTFHLNTSNLPCLPRRIEVKDAVPPAESVGSVRTSQSFRSQESGKYRSESVPFDPITLNCTSIRPANMLICIGKKPYDQRRSQRFADHERLFETYISFNPHQISDNRFNLDSISQKLSHSRITPQLEQQTPNNRRIRSFCVCRIRQETSPTKSGDDEE